MSDKQLQALENQWRKTRTQQDELCYLRARFEQGLVTRSDLEVAWYCGHQPSGTLLTEIGKEPKFWVDHTEYGAWLCRYPERLIVWKVTYPIIVYLGIIDLYLQDFYMKRSYRDDVVEFTRLYTIFEWIRCPCHFHAYEAGIESYQFGVVIKCAVAIHNLYPDDNFKRQGEKKPFALLHEGHNRLIEKLVGDQLLTEDRTLYCRTVHEIAKHAQSILIKHVLYGWQDYESLFKPRQ